MRVHTKESNFKKSGMVSYICHSNVCEVEAGGSKVEGQFGLHREFESLGYVSKIQKIHVRKPQKY